MSFLDGSLLADVVKQQSTGCQAKLITRGGFSQKARMKKYLSALLVAFALAVSSAVQAALVGRDISGHAVAGSDASAVFLYDTDLNITWLRDANAGAGSSFDNDDSTTDGVMTWSNAIGWAADLTVGTSSGWRLPSALNSDGSAPVIPCGLTPLDCASSEMGHLWITELGNSAITATNYGDFLNFRGHPDYWSGTEYALDPDLGNL